MIAIDTNVVVRYLVADDRKQFGRATAVIERQPVFVCMTVVLEVELGPSRDLSPRWARNP